MTVRELKEGLEMNCYANESVLDVEVKTCFIGDLLSYVMGYGAENSVWLTVQAHLNVIAVASLRDFSSIIICGGTILNQEFIDKALQENIAVFSTDLPIYEVAKKLVKLNI